MNRTRKVSLLAPVLAALVAAGACGTSSSTRQSASGPTCIKPEDGKGCLPVAPSSKRIDLARPTFSNPRKITNPLHSNADLDQVIYGGFVDGKAFRTEFTRLDDVKMITWDGQRIPAVTWQYLAYSDGRILEVALDWFAQADDGSVWYLGEDVFNYEDGAIADTHGTWVAGEKAVTKAWADVRVQGVPPIFERQMQADLIALEKATRAADVSAAQGAVLRVAQNDLDLQLLYRPLAEIETARLDLWQRQLAVDTARGDRGAIAGDKETLRWIGARLKTTAKR